jgi:hypothetical protein
MRVFFPPSTTIFDLVQPCATDSPDLPSSRREILFSFSLPRRELSTSFVLSIFADDPEFVYAADIL